MRKTVLIVIGLFSALGLAACRREQGLIRAPGSVEGQVVTVRTLAAGTLDVWTAGEGARLGRGVQMGRLNQDKVLNGMEEVGLAEKEIANQEARLRKKIVYLRVSVEYLRRQTERLARLEKEAAVPGDQLEKARLQLLEAETGLFEAEGSLAALGIQKDKLAVKRRSLELALKDLVIAAPTDCLVLETFVSGGETLLPGAALADVLDEASLYVEVFLEEKEMGRLKPGDPVDILVDGRSGPPLRGTITFFGRRAEFSPKYILSEKEREALLYQVKVRPAGERGVLKVGMPVTVVFRPS